MNDKEDDNFEERKCLLCLDNNIPLNTNEDIYQNLISETYENIGKTKKDLEEKRRAINKKLIEFNKIQRINQSKEIKCILTDATVNKIEQLEKGIEANIPMLLQGETSSGKSFLSIVSSKINKRECISTALSEHTTIEDLYGRDIIKSNSSIQFVPGILLLAYKEGKILILDECDLAKPEILSCILGSLTEDELIICNQVFRKMEGYNVILTMNGEAKGFNEKQRNTLPSNIVSKFNLIKFDEMEKEECKEIFKNLLNQLDQKYNKEDYIKNIDIFIDIHQKMLKDMKNEEELIKNNKIIDPIVTLRNLKYCCYLSRNNISPRIAAEISYTARFPESKRKNYEKFLKKFGEIKEDEDLKSEIESHIENSYLYYNDTYKKVIYLALTALKEGFHPLLIGEKGCGLTTLAKLIASISNKNYEFLLCSSETTVEDLIGCYQPKIKTVKDILETKAESDIQETKTENDIQELSEYVQWFDGPVPKAGKKGVPLILDNINFSKPQVIECLNPLLEENSKYNNVEYNILEKENDGHPIKIKNGFSIIGTMCLTKDNKNIISKALMNRFVAIYVDNNIKINKNNLAIIIENTCKKLSKQIIEQNKIIKEINNDYQENEKDDNSSDDSESIEENNIENNINSYENEFIEKEDEKLDIPEWFNIREISQQTIELIKRYFSNKKIEEKCIKILIKRIIRLAFTYERINKFGFSMEDCDDFINLKFSENREIYSNLQKNILLDSQEKKNKFFFSDFNSAPWKMIMSLISGNISNTAIFLQGITGSGKSCAAKHFGAYRIFQNRNPILTINCHRNLRFDYLVGNYNFKNSEFNFIDGPLLTAMKKGECILLDEFNLCPESVLINLIPIFKANINDAIYLKGVPEQIYIKPGFLLIATGNSPKEKGRKIISSMILDEILTLEIENINLMMNTNLIRNILENEYKEIYQDDDSYKIDKISAKQIKEIDNCLKEELQFEFSLRQIKCLFERIIRFCTEKNYQIEEEENQLITIPVIYVIISYIIPQINALEQKMNEFFNKT